MMGLGTGEILLIIVFALLIFGPKKMPEIGRALGNTFREFKNASQGINEEQTKQKNKDQV